jgi:hypothetical protein
MTGSIAIWSKMLTEVSFLSSYNPWEIGELSPLMFTFQRDGPQVFEKVFSGSLRPT